MKNPEILAEIVKIENPIGRAGWFAYRTQVHPYPYTVSTPLVVAKSVTWEHCRDRVQLIRRDYLDKNGLYFYHRKKAGSKVIAFLHRIETMLKLKEKSKYSKTSSADHILHIKLSPFWLHNLVRRSFLTMALRAGQTYSEIKDNFWECFEKNKYGKVTMPAISAFLEEKRTLYRGTPLQMFQGWYRLFKDKSKDQAKQILKKRETTKTLMQTSAVY